MVIKVKVSDVAAGFGVQNKEVLDLLAQCGAAKKSPSTVLEEGELNALFDRITKTHSVENFDKFYALRSNKPKSQAPQQKKEKKPQSAGNTEKDKKRQSQAAILQMAEQAAKRAEEKAKKKANQTPQARTKGETRHVDTRVNNVDLEKYNQKYEDIAPASNMGDYQKKQKLNQKSKQYRKKRPQGMRARSKRETEAQRLARIAEQRKKQQITIKVPEEITVGELASLLRMTATEVIKKLMSLGVMASVNEVIDYDTAEIVATELGAKVEKQVVVSIEEQIIEEDDENDENAVKRPPVVCVMGHVDHGKTSILDAIRHTDVTSTEAGGITQHIGAYQITVKTGDKITFIDTPGHEAFSEMRARGAKVTDIVVLVVAANDGIMPQTVEAIRHAQAAEVPIVVAINKIDLPGADPMKVKTALLQHGIAVEELGGESLCAEVSAKKRINIDKLVEAILLQAEILDLKANPNRKAEGAVIEAKMEKGRGSVATVLVQKGTLHIGDIVIAGKEWGRVRAMFNEMGKKMNEAGPAAPVEVLGLQGTPAAGDDFIVVADENQAKEVTGYRIRKERDAKLVKSAKSAMEQMLDKIKSGEVKHLPVIIKADVQGSIEAIEGTITKLSNDEVSVQILHSAVGPISDSDVTLAKASNAFIIGFNVRAIPHARDMARQDGVDIRYYSIIYDVADDIKKALEGMLSPELKEKILGYAEIRNVFNITGVGKVAGCMITEGMVKRGAKVRLLRDNVVIHDGSLGQLKRFKDDVKEVKEGYECGMSFENYNDIQVGDFIECYEIESIAAKL